MLKQFIEETEVVIKNVTECNLSMRLTGKYNGNLKILQEDINLMIEKINDAMGSINLSISGVSASSKEVALASNDFSIRTQEMAQGVENISRMVREVDAHVSDTQQQINRVGQGSFEQIALLDSGTALMERSLESMENIRTSSEQITHIVGLIDSIAFQTNLLALNAAVEAARAGEHGRGFAVVAGEVRNLAQKSAEAAKEIKTLINQAVLQSRAGSEVVAELSENLLEVRQKSQEMTEVVKSTESVAQIQADNIHALSAQIYQLNSSIQQNAAFIEESSATAESLSSQAQEVYGVVNQYCLLNLQKNNH